MDRHSRMGCGDRGGLRACEGEMSADPQAAKMLEIVMKAYLAGFASTGEGWNGEHPFSDRGLNPLDDADWCEMRDKFIASILSEAGEAA